MRLEYGEIVEQTHFSGRTEITRRLRCADRLPRDKWSQVRNFRGVYAVTAAEFDLVKVGMSNNIEKRIMQLASCSPFDLKLVALIEGAGREKEEWVHQCLTPWHHRGEWFYWAPYVQSFIFDNFKRV